MGLAAKSSFRCFIIEMKQEAIRSLLHHELDVNIWLLNRPDVAAARPSHCPGCDRPAYRTDGGLRLHGHGVRERLLWGLPWPDATPTLWEVVLRRYRCTDCHRVCTVAPRGIATCFRYSLASIALAFVLWGLWNRTAAATRASVSPWHLVGDSTRGTWRSLGRWARRAAKLFDHEADGIAATMRAQARRAAHLIVARGPSDSPTLERAFVGAHFR